MWIHNDPNRKPAFWTPNNPLRNTRELGSEEELLGRKVSGGTPTYECTSALAFQHVVSP